MQMYSAKSFPTGHNSMNIVIHDSSNDYGHFIDTETMKYIHQSVHHNRYDTKLEEDMLSNNTAEYSKHDEYTHIYAYIIVSIISFSATIFVFDLLHK